MSPGDDHDSDEKYAMNDAEIEKSDDADETEKMEQSENEKNDDDLDAGQMAEEDESEKSDDAGKKQTMEDLETEEGDADDANIERHTMEDVLNSEIFRQELQELVEQELLARADIYVPPLHNIISHQQHCNQSNAGWTQGTRRLCRR